MLLHGFGAPGDDLVGLAAGLGDSAGIDFVFPEAPTDLADLGFPALGPARAWWMIDVGRWEQAARAGRMDALTREEPKGLAEARDALGGMIDAMIADGTDPSRIVLGGFSQGSMLATDFMLRSDRPFAGLVILSGALICADVWRSRLPARDRIPVFQSHGTDDPILPFGVARTLHQEFVDAGFDAGFEAFPGGHGIPASVMRDLASWLFRGAGRGEAGLADGTSARASG